MNTYPLPQNGEDIARLSQDQYLAAVNNVAQIYQLTTDECRILLEPNHYCREHFDRDAKTFAWLRETERLGWLLPFYHIIAAPNNVLIKLDFEDLQSIFERIAPPANIDELASLFGGLSL